MGRGKRRPRRGEGHAEPQSAARAGQTTTRDDQQLVAAQATRPVAGEGAAAGRPGAEAMDGRAQAVAKAAGRGRGPPDAAEREGGDSPASVAGHAARVAVAAAGGSGAGAGQANGPTAPQEENAAHAAGVVDVSAPRAPLRAQVAAATQARSRAQAAAERESSSSSRGQERRSIAQSPEENEEDEEEEETHWSRDPDRGGRAAGPSLVAARAQVGRSPLAPKEADQTPTEAVGVRVLLDGRNERAGERLARGVEAVPKTRSVTSGSLLSYESEDEPRPRALLLEEEEIEDPELGRVIVPKIRSFTLDSSASSQLERYISEELHPDITASDPHSLHHIRASTSPCSSVVGSESGIPHSKSLVMDDIPPSTVFQAVPTSHIDAVEVVAEQSWLITKLTVQLLWALRMSKRWIMCALRLVWFVLILLPPIFKVFLYWLVDPNIHKNIIYGLNARNLLDVYVPPKRATYSRDHEGGKKPAHKYPVVVFISGGAWIIGYKAWGALMGRVLSCFGVVVVMPDYRNFPQGILPDMVEDATRALQWVFDNIHLFGGDRDNVTLIGQSAGAHISMCALLEQVERKEQAVLSGGGSRRGSISNSYSSSAMINDQDAFSRTFSSSNLSVTSVESVESAFTRPPTWELKQIRSYIGISGPYNMEASLATFHRHGFDKGVVERIMAHRLAYYSPSLRLLAKSELREYSHALDDFPPVYLFHGTADKTVSWQSTEQLAHALEACKIPVKTRFFEGKTHTDPIIEDPICGDDFLLDEIVAIMKERSPVDPRTGRTVSTLGDLQPEKRYYPSLLTRFARRVNPF